MPTIQIGQYTRSGIYINEFDNSILPNVVAPTGNYTLVIGFSKVGPVNTPVLLQSQNDLTNIFGSIDRSLERNGSFFHRTIQQMLLSGSVYALNLLETDNTLDLLQYASLSTACNYPNYINSNGAPYSQFFNTTGFWKKDTESFNYLANTEANGSTDGNNQNRLFNITNMSGNYVTLFIYKTKSTGYNNSLINYYGSIENIPPYLKSTDWASDYMVDVLAVSGDWTNYSALSVDPRWNKYFDATGLKKGQLSNFASDRNINVLSFYSNLSFIPYFTDLSGNNLFIETVINNDFAKTGLFCSFNMDLYETSYPNGLVDLIGNSIDSTNSINFLSYKDTIVENVEFKNTYLDRAGNVFGIDILGATANPQRNTGFFGRDFKYSEGYVNDVSLSFTPIVTTQFQNATQLSGPTSGSYMIGSYTYSSNNLLFTINVTASSYTQSGGATYGTSTASIFTSISATGIGLTQGGIDGTFLQIPSYIFGGTTSANNASASSNFPIDINPFNSSLPDSLNGFKLTVYDSTNSVVSDNTITYPPSTYSSIIASGIEQSWATIATASGWSISATNSTFLSIKSLIKGSLYNSYSYKVTFYNILGQSSTSNLIPFSGGQDSTIIATTPIIIKLSYLSSLTISYNAGETSYAISNGNIITGLTNSSLIINPSLISLPGTYYTTYVLNNGGINALTSAAPGLLPNVQQSDIVLGAGSYNVFGNNITSLTYSDITVDNTGFIELVNNIDYVYTLSNGVLDLTFLNTAVTPNVNNYVTYRKIKAFNYLLSIVSSSNFIHGAFLKTTGNNALIDTTKNMSLLSYTNNNLSDRNIQININQNGTSLNQIVFYLKDDEFVISNQGFKTSNILPISATGYGSVRYQSTFYQDYYNGVINTGDYFYDNLIAGSTTSVIFKSVNGTNYVKFSNANLNTLSTNNILLVSDSVLNTFTFSITNVISATYGIVIDAGSNNVTDETIALTSKVYETNSKNTHYLQMEFIDDLLNVTFVDKVQVEKPIDQFLTLPTLIDVTSYDGEYKESVEIKSIINANTIAVDGLRYSNIQIGDFLSAYYDENILEVGEVPKKITRILTRKINPSNTTQVLLSCDSQIAYNTYNGIMETTRYSSIDNYITTYKGISLKGFRMRNASIPDGTEARQSSILDLVGKGTPLFAALSNKDAIDFRYLIDSFGLGLTEYSKQQLVDICGERLDCFGFLNMPSMKQFKQSSSPSFIDANGVLQTSYIAAGGNLDKNPAFLYSFGTGKGITCVGYFAPYVTVNDNGRPFDVPIAMFVATTYMKKINANSSSITPWTIAAGITNGKISGFGKTEIDFTPQDISNLNMGQINPIVYKKNRGYVIETENTAQTDYKSALSYIHCREVLIELERDLSAMLLDFQWKYNTNQTRAEIKQRADAICSTYVSKNGLYNYFNKCDQENNTQIIIDNQIGVLDTYVEIIRGMGIIVNNITILKTGAISSGGFQ
jgi:uncharacterized protein YuzB (UPF0349 family)